MAARLCQRESRPLGGGGMHSKRDRLPSRIDYAPLRSLLACQPLLEAPDPCGPRPGLPCGPVDRGVPSAAATSAQGRRRSGAVATC